MSHKISSYFPRITPEQAAEQASRQVELIQHERQARQARKQLDGEKRSLKVKQDATRRQQRKRQREKESEVKLGLRDPQTLRKIKVMQLRQESPEPGDPHPTPSKRRTPRTNYYEPTRWKIVENSSYFIM
ncbi:unnamed protein product [Rhizoctonia solani]|uniref:Uncharacterized protein n=1 Tax=Rhizoctonia solani TaxID=456999 RepID=A0A8H2Y4I9_9AGAM|nr:unnamed protein product [Rhizoctonia solani]